MACKPRPHCPLAMAGSQVPGPTKVNIQIVFEGKKEGSSGGHGEYLSWESYK